MDRPALHRNGTSPRLSVIHAMDSAEARHAHGRAIQQGTPFVDFTRQYEFRPNSSHFARQDFDARGNIEATKGSGGGTTLSNQGVMAVRQGFAPARDEPQANRGVTGDLAKRQ